MLKPRKAKTVLAIATRSAIKNHGLPGFPEGFAVYLGKKKLKYIDGVEVGVVIRPLTDNAATVFNQSKVARTIYRVLQNGFVQATIGTGAKYYGLRKLPKVAKKKETYIEELQESLFGKPDYSHIGINARNDEGNTSTMDRLTRKIANNPGVSGAFDNRVAGLLQQGTGHTTLTSECRSIRNIALEMADHNVNVAMRKLNFSKVKVMYTSDVMKDVEAELHACHDDRNYINRLLGLRETLPLSAGTYTIVDEMIGLPLLSQLTDAICAAGKRAMATLPPDDAAKLNDPTPETLVDWLILFGSLNQPKTLDYLPTLNVGELGTNPEELREIYQRVRQIAGINVGDEAVALDIANAMRISPRFHDHYAISRALRDGEPVLYTDMEKPIDLTNLREFMVSTPETDRGEALMRMMKSRADDPKAKAFTFDSLSQHPDVLGKEDKDA